MTEPQVPVAVAHNQAAQRFEVVVDDLLCRADYERDGDTLRFHHTEVPPALGGRGIAAALVRAALDHAQANGLHVVPACSYVRTYMQRHPETHALLPPGVSL
jgi:hypothetical protein